MTKTLWTPQNAASIARWAETHAPGFMDAVRAISPPCDEATLNDFAVVCLLKRGDLTQCEECSALHNDVECPHCKGTCGCAGGHGH